MKLLIKNGRVIDPANKRDGVFDVLVENGKISKVAKNIKLGNAEIIDAKDKIVIPGLFDMHVHLREPGREDKETIKSATKAALKGGVTSVLAMPNTIPAIDSVENVKLVERIINKTACANVFIAGTITKNRLGEKLVDIVRLKKKGVVAITDDGSSVDKDDLFLEALKKAKANKLLVICHSENKELSANGMVNLGLTSTRMGLRGISKESEYKRVSRDIKLAEKSAAAVHIAHISCRESVELIAKAKKKSINITCETAPHYFSLSEEDTLNYDTNKKMNPPLRGKDDIEAIKQGLKNGTIDAIASDHAPHTENEKDIEFEHAEFGVVGLETELAAAITELVDTGILDWPQLVKKMSFNPARILGTNRGTLNESSAADIIIVSPDKEWMAIKENIISKSKNSPFLGKKLKGVVEYTICDGKIVYQGRNK